MGTGDTWQQNCTARHVSSSLARCVRKRAAQASSSRTRRRRASPDTTRPSRHVSRLPHVVPAPMATAGGIKAAQGGSDAPLCLKVLAPCSPLPNGGSGTRCAGAVFRAGGWQEALQARRAAFLSVFTQLTKFDARHGKQRRALRRRRKRERHAERRRFHGLPDRRRRPRLPAAAHAVHHSRCRWQDVRFPPSRLFWAVLTNRAAACLFAVARWFQHPQPSLPRPAPRSRAWRTPQQSRPRGALFWVLPYPRTSPCRYARSVPARRVQPIEALNPYQSAWTIRVRAAGKGALRTVKTARGEVSVFSVELTDEQVWHACPPPAARCPHACTDSWLLTPCFAKGHHDSGDCLA